MNGAGNGEAVQKERLLALIEKVPVFVDLTSSERSNVLARCTKVTLECGDILCAQGEESSAMFILLLGKLAVRISRSAPVATLVPITSIGEMGVFTGEPRSATVEAMEKSALLRLEAAEMNSLIEQNPSLGVRIMRRVIRILAERVSTDNARIREFQNYLIDLGRIE
jgi:CRP-like cAMP-binding protein